VALFEKIYKAFNENRGSFPSIGKKKKIKIYFYFLFFFKKTKTRAHLKIIDFISQLFPPFPKI